MSKTLISFMVVGVVLVGGYFVYNSQQTKDSEIVNNEANQESDNGSTAQQPAGKKMAFSQFIKQDMESYKCEVKQSVSDFASTGTVYMNAGKIRGDFSTIAEGRNMNSYFIMKDGYTYNWSDLAPMGVKVKVTTDGGNTSTETSGTYGWNAEQIGEYNCEEWKADESKFSIPTNINFSTIN